MIPSRACGRGQAAKSLRQGQAVMIPEEGANGGVYIYANYETRYLTVQKRH